MNYSLACDKNSIRHLVSNQLGVSLRVPLQGFRAMKRKNQALYVFSVVFAAQRAAKPGVYPVGASKIRADSDGLCPAGVAGLSPAFQRCICLGLGNQMLN
jgi:hypothetical protein